MYAQFNVHRGELTAAVYQDETHANIDVIRDGNVVLREGCPHIEADPPGPWTVARLMDWADRLLDCVLNDEPGALPEGETAYDQPGYVNGPPFDDE